MVDCTPSFFFCKLPFLSILSNNLTTCNHSAHADYSVNRLLANRFATEIGMRSRFEEPLTENIEDLRKQIRDVLNDKARAVQSSTAKNIAIFE